MSVKFLFLILALVFPCFLTAGTAHAAASRFVDAETYFSTTETGYSLLPSGFQAIESELNKQFAAVCPDSFCEGDVSNWSPLALTCSIDQDTHVVGECSWSFAGSFAVVDPASGNVTVSYANRTCDLGFAGTSSDLAEFLLRASEAKGHAFGLLSPKVPGRADGMTLFDVLSSCL